MGPQYTQTYRKGWETLPELKDWLRPVSTNTKKAYCIYCKCEIVAKLYDLQNHAKAKKHVKASEPFSSDRQSRIAFPKCSETPNHKVCKAEGDLSLFVAAHTSFLTVDHLSELCKHCFCDSKSATNIKLHRSKCKSIIVNILAPHFTDNLRSDIGDGKYSILIDESTDIAVIKLLGVTIRYFSPEMKKFVSTYLGLLEIEAGSAQCIAKAVIKLLRDLNLQPQKLIGVGVDNASVNTGLNSGVCELLKKELELPNLIMIRCVCHSVQLAVSHSVGETLPRNIDYLVRETYNWFSHSSKRQIVYRQLFETLNDGKEPLKIPRVCDTRWLSIEPAVTRILSQWDELKLHFQIVRSSEKCYSAETLYEMYCDPVSKLYLLFLRPVLHDVQRVVKNFQGENVDPTKLLQDLTNLIISTSNRVIVPGAKVDPLASDISSFVDRGSHLGYEFEKTSKESKLPNEKETSLRKRCISFAVKLCNELRCRLPDNIKVLKKMSLFSPSECLRAIKEPIVDVAEVLGYTPEQIEKVESQWRNLSYVKWHDNQSTVSLWTEVGRYRDASDINPFQELYDLAISILSLPHSNAEVERLFSQLNIVKSKLRNRLNTTSVSALLTVRCGLRRLEKCCYSYELPESVVRRIGTMATYTLPQNPVTSCPGPSSANTVAGPESEDEEDENIFSV